VAVRIWCYLRPGLDSDGHAHMVLFAPYFQWWHKLKRFHMRQRSYMGQVVLFSQKVLNVLMEPFENNVLNPQRVAYALIALLKQPAPIAQMVPFGCVVAPASLISQAPCEYPIPTPGCPGYVPLVNHYDVGSQRMTQLPGNRS
jgi:hypothetical protein